MCHLCIRILMRELQVRNLRIMMMMEMEVVMVMIVTGVKAQRHLMPEVFLAGTRLMLWQGHSSA